MSVAVLLLVGCVSFCRCCVRYVISAIKIWTAGVGLRSMTHDINCRNEFSLQMDNEHRNVIPISKVALDFILLMCGKLGYGCLNSRSSSYLYCCWKFHFKYVFENDSVLLRLIIFAWYPLDLYWNRFVCFSGISYPVLVPLGWSISQGFLL